MFRGNFHFGCIPENRSYCSVNLTHFAQKITSMYTGKRHHCLGFDRLLIATDLFLRIPETRSKGQQEGKIQSIQHITSLPAYRIDDKFQSLKTNGHTQPLTIAVVKDLWKVETSARRRALTLDTKAAEVMESRTLQQLAELTSDRITGMLNDEDHAG